VKLAAGALLVSAALFAALPARAECYPEHAQAAQDAANRARDWHDVHEVFVRSSMCDDGAVAKAFSDSVVRVLADHWELTATLNRLAVADPKFHRFVLHHIAGPMNGGRAIAIRDYARHHCPRGSTALCAAIIERVSEAATD
jgi:hypothetical protein